MGARNTARDFGWVTRLIHWLTALGVILMLALGTYIASIRPSLGNLWLFGLHKSLGLSLFALTLARLSWHLLSPPPAPLSEGVPRWQVTAARAVHWMLYALLLAIPLSGWIASAATGIDVVLFGRLTLPPIVPPSETLDRLFFRVHGVLTSLLAVLILLHAGAAVHHHLLRRDRTLRRMIEG
ncbi:cytochrome b [Cereibacter sphaeroides]|uniref:cytochrome b n=1 Tax=Cereibacter sphaeroides TaxID=1063 RepID=UPI001F1FF741|nr:cytochrome b [Cereibacter sphaeroides]MCE6960652.1 cytochrome b [Cereibacter sphaeroides]MCE6970081.1 cytochrome b [Cereibacter sphaeroides]MCE6973246.1 cytochrome b [Cereibacter sphaeroides]